MALVVRRPRCLQKRLRSWWATPRRSTLCLLLVMLVAGCGPLSCLSHCRLLSQHATQDAAHVPLFVYWCSTGLASRTQPQSAIALHTSIEMEEQPTIELGSSRAPSALTVAVLLLYTLYLVAAGPAMHQPLVELPLASLWVVPPSPPPRVAPLYLG